PRARQGAQCSIGDRTCADRRGRTRARRRRNGRQPDGGRSVRPCDGPSASRPYRPHPHVRRLGARIDDRSGREAGGGACRGRRSMITIDRDRTTLLVIDFQQRLMPAIDGASAVLANAGRLIEAAKKLGVPAIVTEQYPKGLGPTVAELAVDGMPKLAKMDFDATRAAGFFDLLPKDRPDIVV